MDQERAESASPITPEKLWRQWAAANAVGDAEERLGVHVVMYGDPVSGDAVQQGCCLFNPALPVFDE